MKKLFPILAALLFTLGAAAAASADTACFDWACDDATGTCTFDLSCSSADPFIWKKVLSFGDGTSTGPVGGNVFYHTYSLPTYAHPTVSLTIYPWSDNGSTATSCEIVVRNYFGPPLATSGRCSSGS